MDNGECWFQQRLENCGRWRKIGPQKAPGKRGEIEGDSQDLKKGEEASSP